MSGPPPINPSYIASSPAPGIHINIPPGTIPTVISMGIDIYSALSNYPQGAAPGISTFAGAGLSGAAQHQKDAGLPLSGSQRLGRDIIAGTEGGFTSVIASGIGIAEGTAAGPAFPLGVIGGYGSTALTLSNTFNYWNQNYIFPSLNLSPTP